MATTTTTTKVAQCFACSQNDGDKSGACWNPAGSDSGETLQVCDGGCFQKFYQVVKTYEGDAPQGFDTQIDRGCKSSSDVAADLTETVDINHCRTDFCNSIGYAGSGLANHLSVFLFLAVIVRALL